MSRVERIENPPADRRGNESRQAGSKSGSPQKNPSPGPTPTKAEGEPDDIEEALEHQSE